MNIQEIKQRVSQMIDEHADQIIEFAKQIEKTPELGYKEFKTSAQTAQFLKELGFFCREGIALTGVRTSLKEGTTGPNVALLGELDAILCPDSPQADPLTGAAHACGHNLQLAALVGAALGLKLADISDELAGNVTFMAVPAEEYVEIAYRLKLREEGKIHFLGGKQELLYLGEFDDIDMALMIHSAKDCPEASVGIGESSNGFIGKTIQYIGKESHAADAPEEGVNALNAAMLGLMGIHALRETFREQDIVRVHPIITKGGDLVNVVPADVKIETYVRAKTMEAINATHQKVDRALKAGGDAVGAQTKIQTLPGYLPLQCSSSLNEIFVENTREFAPEANIIYTGHFSASTDMGDISHVIPVAHPYIGGTIGQLHSINFRAKDYYAACVLPAKLMALTVIDLLASGAEKGQMIIKEYKPQLTKEQYLQIMENYFSTSEQ